MFLEGTRNPASSSICPQRHNRHQTREFFLETVSSTININPARDKYCHRNFDCHQKRHSLKVCVPNSLGRVLQKLRHIQQDRKAGFKRRHPTHTVISNAEYTYPAYLPLLSSLFLMNFLNSFLGSSVPPKMDSTVDTRRQLVAAMPKVGHSNSSTDGPAQRTATAPTPATGAADAAFLNSQLDGGAATSGAHNFNNNHSSTNHATTSRSFYNEDRLLDPDFIDHLAEYSDTEEGPDDDWGNFGNDDDGYDANLEPGFTPENVFGPTEDDTSSKATGSTTLNLNKPSATAEAKYQYQATSAKPQVYPKPAPTRPAATRAAPQKRKSFTLTDDVHTRRHDHHRGLHGPTGRHMPSSYEQ